MPTNRWSDEEFRREIEVIKEERRQRTEESPRARMFEAFNAMSYLASPYRRPVIGWMSDLDAMTPQGTCASSTAAGMCPATRPW